MSAQRFAGVLVAIAAGMLLAGCDGEDKTIVYGDGTANIDRGRIALTQYACHACHVIPGVTGSRASVGPPLEGIGKRPLIAGKLPNTPDNMMRWIRHPKQVDPQTAMPDMGVQEQHARDMAAYLSTLK